MHGKLQSSDGHYPAVDRNTDDIANPSAQLLSSSTLKPGSISSVQRSIGEHNDDTKSSEPTRTTTTNITIITIKSSSSSSSPPPPPPSLSGKEKPNNTERDTSCVKALLSLGCDLGDNETGPQQAPTTTTPAPEQPASAPALLAPRTIIPIPSNKVHYVKASSRSSSTGDHRPRRSGGDQLVPILPHNKKHKQTHPSAGYFPSSTFPHPQQATVNSTWTPFNSNNNDGGNCSNSTHGAPNHNNHGPHPTDFWYWLGPGEALGEWDVLCGRGGESNNFIGNKKYRRIVSDRKEEYRNIPLKQRREKTAFVRNIVQHVNNCGGRFVDLDETSGKYYVVTMEKARKKTSQALRETKELKWLEINNRGGGGGGGSKSAATTKSSIPPNNKNSSIYIPTTSTTAILRRKVSQSNKNVICPYCHQQGHKTKIAKACLLHHEWLDDNDNNHTQQPDGLHLDDKGSSTTTTDTPSSNITYTTPNNNTEPSSQGLGQTSNTVPNHKSGSSWNASSGRGILHQPSCHTTNRVDNPPISPGAIEI